MTFLDALASAGKGKILPVSAVEAKISRAWQVRQECFPGQVDFVTPEGTLPISVTGSSCELQCAHCAGIYLKGMLPLEEFSGRKRGRMTSYLLSGGCDRQGRVPLSGRWAEIEALARCGPLNVHSGLVDEQESAQLGRLARVVSFDFVADQNIIRQVYGLPFTGADYLKSYRALLKHTRVVPHICIGINAGIIDGEYRALELLKNEAVEAISFIVLRPTAGTAFAAASPPAPEAVALFLAEARLAFPLTPLYLGCMRPGGLYRDKLDPLALKAGVNKIVLPAPAARKMAEKFDLTITHSKECCAL